MTISATGQGTQALTGWTPEAKALDGVGIAGVCLIWTTRTPFLLGVPPPSKTSKNNHKCRTAPCPSSPHLKLSKAKTPPEVGSQQTPVPNPLRPFPKPWLNFPTSKAASPCLGSIARLTVRMDDVNKKRRSAALSSFHSSFN
jgi:hypothetical protein